MQKMVGHLWKVWCYFWNDSVIQAPSAIEATTRTAAFGTETKFLGETKLEDVRSPDPNLDEKLCRI